MLRHRRLPLLVAALAVTAAGSTACYEANGTEGKNYVSGDGLVTLVDTSDRKDPVDVSGETLDGGRLDLSDLRGQVVIVNVWGAWCPECRAEAPTLVQAEADLSGTATVVGVDIRETSKDNAVAFERTFGITWPSIYDPGSETLLRFPSPYNPRETPSTMVLDRQGRLAALIRGQLPSKRTLTDVVDQVAAEGGQADG
jgi:thiol-disulfide isomerase/thioredoxin